MELATDYVTNQSPCHVKNEDNFICNDRYVVIADGMGGEACGDIASGIAISAISKILDSSLEGVRTEDEIRKLSFFAISKADEEISKYVAEHPEADGMGTTVVLLIHIDQIIFVAWCGDSRCYYYDTYKGLNSLTTDHSYVQQLIDEGRLSVEDSFTHPDNNLITKYVGGGENVCLPEFVTSKFDSNGCIILCSDGLSGYCKTEEIEKELQQCSYDNLPQRLLKLAVRKGSDDDITIVTLIPKVHKTTLLGWLKKLMHR